MNKRSPRIQVTALACLLVIVAVVLTLWAAHGAEDGSGDRNDQHSEVHGLSAAIEGLGGHRGKRSNAKRWLDDLDASTDAAPAVEWTESRGLVNTTSTLLRRYERIGSVTLKTHGYLDLKGNVWGAIASDRKGWVDMVTVMSNEADSETTVRVVRLVADRLGRS